MNAITATITHLFTPHHTNNHRPRILHPEMLVAVAAVVFVLHTTMQITAQSYPLILGYATNISTEDLLFYTNQERLNHGLNSLQLNTTLSKAAEKKAQDMFADNYWAHTAPDGATPWDFIVTEGYAYSYAGENLARDFSDSKGVVVAWMNSPSHRDNLLRGEYQEIGFAVVNGKLDGNETTLVVQMFGTPQTRRPIITNASVSDTSEVAMQVPTPMISSVPIAQIEEDSSLPRAVQKPVIDQAAMQRNVGYTVMGVFGTVLLVDSFLIWKRKTVRIAGHNLAHFIFIVSLIGFVILSSRGSILSSAQ
ncbi:MAG: CAP domain-containing protein [Candidatus Roizmanbacteria bacterium]|nr:CAP domain-containing protein [Candidatus Roizmanbacteria bacterium]